MTFSICDDLPGSSASTMKYLLFAVIGALGSFLLASSDKIPESFELPSSDETPPSHFAQFHEVLNRSVLKAPNFSDEREDLNDFAEWLFQGFKDPNSGSMYIQFAAIGSGHMSIIQQMKKQDDGTFNRADWNVNDRNGVAAEVLVPEQEADAERFTVISLSGDGTRVGYDRDIVLLRVEWRKTYHEHSDVILAHYRKSAEEDDNEVIVIGPRQNSPQKFLCEVSSNRVSFEVDDETIIDNDELLGWDQTVLWANAGVSLYSSEPELANARAQFKSVNWV